MPAAGEVRKHPAAVSDGHERKRVIAQPRHPFGSGSPNARLVSANVAITISYNGRAWSGMERQRGEPLPPGIERALVQIAVRVAGQGGDLNNCREALGGTAFVRDQVLGREARVGRRHDAGQRSMISACARPGSQSPRAGSRCLRRDATAASLRRQSSRASRRRGARGSRADASSRAQPAGSASPPWPRRGRDRPSRAAQAALLSSGEATRRPLPQDEPFNAVLDRARKARHPPRTFCRASVIRHGSLAAPNPEAVPNPKRLSHHASSAAECRRPSPTSSNASSELTDDAEWPPALRVSELLLNLISDGRCDAA